ncbi:MAG: ATP phosphoribosyltransferase [Pseudomonadales bacterium]|jgi:ATP phosphoribosyltransferase|nr:ATP phosphoribosyltransferase [Gammaproteobacteria bacterium]MBL6744827.1 ATP phosphoribosyltransferase [Pseudomonadales bacterium]HAU25274.1 ATP phosphoribosyltransferase [Gammaproteobacteria bacterium]HBJ89230.1 ATP phosphoribosyltransferase [Gammaproteobacteria bacterium]HCL73877.1 ATP phosphoribosyltransferase [Gammaproteobacteria bacterium]|tara:strand:- start:3029 stop:3673 length:645 start_codon:yes stop_codon:yes gene_type:complete
MTATELVIALTKGRILRETLPLFESAGIRPLEDIEKSRKLLFDTNVDGVKLLLMRGSDVPTYVRFGSADIGVAGKDLILENGSDGFYEPLDLKIATCKMMTAEPVDAPVAVDRLRVATKFTNIAKRFYAERGQQIELIKLNGALELAPSLGLADAIVDIVDTGKTLKANGLVAKDTIADISSRVIVNKASMKIKNAMILDVLAKLRDAVTSVEA